jgi:hypothetical protein
MNTALTLQIGGDISKLRNELNKANGLMGGFQKTVGNVAKAATGLFAAVKLLDFGKHVFDVTAEFQKFEAVLTNTLGSNSAAKAALSQITEFAAKTPFQVNELTESFVKLANQGFVPTLGEMRSLGDLASAMGKSFNQLTEAIIDAQTGEFERLKEFGIRAQKQGDKVTFTFKGVKKQVDFTADSIREYILSLGQAEGVSGGMEAISKTLGGGLSNLKDAWDQLALAIGTSANSGGALSKGLEILSQMVHAVKSMFDPVQRLQDEIAMFTRLRAEAGADNDIEEWVKWNTLMIESQTKLNALTESLTAGEEELAKIRAKAAAADAAAKADAAAAAEKALQQQAASLAKWKSAASGGLRLDVTKKTGSDFLFDSGAMVEMANVGASALKNLNTALKVNTQEWNIWWAGVQTKSQQAAEALEKHQEKTRVLAEQAVTIGSAMGDVFGAIATAQEDMAQTMLRVTEQIITMFLQQSIAAMIAAAMKDPSTPFPFAKIAIAAAGIGMVKAMFGKIGASGGSSGGGGAPGRTPSEMNVNVSSRSKIKGYDIVSVSEKEGVRRGRVG